MNNKFVVFVLALLLLVSVSTQIGNTAYIGDPSTVINLGKFSLIPYKWAIEQFNATAYQSFNSTGYTIQSLDDAALIQACIDDVSAVGGEILIVSGTYTASVTLKTNIRLVIEKGATGITVAIDAGATCVLEDYNNSITWYYSSGVLMLQYNNINGAIAGVYATFTEGHFSQLYVNDVNMTDPLAGVTLPYTYTVYKSGSTYYMEDSDGNVDYSSTNASKVITFALGNLTASRTAKETIYLKGTFQVDSQILLDSYTRLIIDGCLNSTMTGVDSYILNAVLESNIEILGGEINGNDLTASGSCGISFDRVTDSLVRDVYVHNISYTVASGSASYGFYGIDCQRVNVENCKFEYNDHGGAIWAESEYCTFKNCIGNRNAEGGNDTRHSANFVVYGVSGDYCQFIKILNCYSNGSLNQGIQVYQYANNTLIEGCTVTYAANDNIVVGNQVCYHTTIAGNHIYGKGGQTTAGIDLSNYAVDTIVTNNYIGEVQGGILMERYSNYSQIIGNHLYGNISSWGIMCMSSHNIIHENIIEIQTNIGYGPAIQMDDLATTIMNNSICFNRIKVDGQPSYGIICEGIIGSVFRGNLIETLGGSDMAFSIEADSTDNIIEQNTISGPTSFLGTNLVRWNIGYKTEASGNATIATGTTSIAWAHGMVSAPALVFIQCTNSTVTTLPTVAKNATYCIITGELGSGNYYVYAQTWNYP